MNIRRIFSQFWSKLPTINRVYEDFAVLPWYFALRLLMVVLFGVVFAQVRSSLSLSHEPVYDFGILSQIVDWFCHSFLSAMSLFTILRVDTKAPE